MFGNNPALASAARPWDGLLETLGRLCADPRAALEDIVQTPRLGSGFTVAVLGSLGRALLMPLPWDRGPWVFLGRVFAVFASSLLLWVILAGAVHVLSAALGKKGGFASFLALSGWAWVILWAELPFRLAGAAPAVVFLPTMVFRFAAAYVLWWGLRRVYGWSGGGAAAVLAFPLVLLGAGVFTATLAGLLLGNAALLKSLLP